MPPGKGPLCQRPLRGVRRTARLAAITAIALLASGCLWTPELSQIQQGIERQLPGAAFNNATRISLGPLSLGLARFLTRVIPEGQLPQAGEAHAYLQEVRRVQVALYETESLPSLRDLHMPHYLKDLVQREDWHLAVKTQESDRVIWVLTREQEGVIRDIYVVTLDAQALMLVRVEGRMEQLLAKAMENRAEELPQMLGLDLH